MQLTVGNSVVHNELTAQSIKHSLAMINNEEPVVLAGESSFIQAITEDGVFMVEYRAADGTEIMRIDAWIPGEAAATLFCEFLERGGSLSGSTLSRDTWVGTGIYVDSQSQPPQTDSPKSFWSLFSRKK